MFLGSVDRSVVRASAMHDIAVASCFCLVSMPLSRFWMVSVTAAFASGLRHGASMSVQLAGTRYLSESSLRTSLDKPEVAMCWSRNARSGCMSLP